MSGGKKVLGNPLDVLGDLYSNGDIRTRKGVAGGGDVHGRHLYAGMAGGVHIYDGNSPTDSWVGFEIAGDGQPSGNYILRAGGSSGPADVMAFLTSAPYTSAHITQTAINGLVLNSVIQPTTTGSANNWSPAGLVDGFGGAGTAVIEWKGTSSLSITGLYAAQMHGTTVVLKNASVTAGAFFTFAADVSSSTATNRLRDAPISLGLSESCALIYDANQSRWLTLVAPTNSDIQIFSASGTWTKPLWAKWVDVYLIGGGGGGGSGCKGAASTLRRGGQGGGGAGVSQLTLLAASLGGTETVTIGAGGGGGASGNAATGNDGTAGGDTTFGTYVRAQGGAKGKGGTAAAFDGSAVTALGTVSDGTPNTLSSTTGGVGSAGANSRYGGSAGGAGGGITTANATSGGGDGGAIAVCSGLTTAGGAGAVTAGSAGTAGTTPATDHAGTGGGGGASSTAGNGGNGGAGGRGSGGGGGGATQTGNSGAGGNGGAGRAIVISGR